MSSKSKSSWSTSKTCGGGRKKGVKYPTNPDGKRSFTLKVTDEVRKLLDLPQEEDTVGTFLSKKPIEAASRAYTFICHHNVKGETCPEIKLTILDTQVYGGEGLKEHKYFISRYPNPKYDPASGQTYQWKYDIIPVKTGNRNENKKIREPHKILAQDKYKRLPVKPKKPTKSNRKKTVA